jgi:CBS domain-containing protein
MDVKSLLNHKATRLITVTPETKITDAVSLMMQNRIGSLPVVEDGALVSIITERDVMFALNSHAENIQTISVREIMAGDLVTCTAECPIQDAMTLMFDNKLGRRIRHLPITEDGKLVGIVSNGDLLDAMLDETEFENRIMKNYITNWPEESA